VTIPVHQQASLRRRVAYRLLPFLSLLYMAAYLDRANVAFASAPMRANLGFSEAVFGLGSGIFFVGYLILEIPGALIVQKYGARRWMSRILITWGLMTILVGMVRTAHEFYIARFLLGAAEAGFFPGLIVYLNQWFREEERARAMSMFIVAAPIALALGSPLSALILQFDIMNVPSWRWLFILEGIPAILLGIATLWYLTDSPMQAQWLPEPERLWLANQLKREREQRNAVPDASWWKALFLPDVILLTLANLFACMAGYGITLWLPSNLEHFGSTSQKAGVSGAWLAFIPFLGAIGGAVVIGWISDKLGKPRLCAGCTFVSAAICLFFATQQKTQGLALFWFTLTEAAVFGWIAPFWVLPTLLLSESPAAAAIGLINSLGNLGGFAGPFLVGYLLSMNWPFQRAVLTLCSAYVVAAILTFTVGRRATDDACRALT
jgi:MFS transporter, ACS family, tartrate transporter